MLKAHGVRGKLLNGMKGFYKDANSWVKVQGSEVRIGNAAVKMCFNDANWKLNMILFSNNTLLIIYCQKLDFGRILFYLPPLRRFDVC